MSQGQGGTFTPVQNSLKMLLKAVQRIRHDGKKRILPPGGIMIGLGTDLAKSGLGDDDTRKQVP